MLERFMALSRDVFYFSGFCPLKKRFFLYCVFEVSIFGIMLIIGQVDHTTLSISSVNQF